MVVLSNYGRVAVLTTGDSFIILDLCGSYGTIPMTIFESPWVCQIILTHLSCHTFVSASSAFFTTM